MATHYNSEDVRIFIAGIEIKGDPVARLFDKPDERSGVFAIDDLEGRPRDHWISVTIECSPWRRVLAPDQGDDIASALDGLGGPVVEMPGEELEQ